MTGWSGRVGVWRLVVGGVLLVGESPPSRTLVRYTRGMTITLDGQLTQTRARRDQLIALLEDATDRRGAR